MYYVPDGTKECGYYECKKCGNRFLSLQTMNTLCTAYQTTVQTEQTVNIMGSGRRSDSGS